MDLKFLKIFHINILQRLQIQKYLPKGFLIEIPIRYNNFQGKVPLKYTICVYLSSQNFNRHNFLSQLLFLK